MINYELAKELKDAGFPQKDCPVEFRCVCGSTETLGGHVIHHEDGRCVVYLPTLSELIEACGDRFQVLSHMAHGWLAGRLNHDGGVETLWGEPYGIGTSPEEAVARLWLALNLKDHD